MCGLVGLFDVKGYQSFERRLVQTMNDAQWRRGPDAEGLMLEPGIAFGHRRLSIIDVKSGQQPMWSSDSRYCLIFNGEIYNFRTLRQELIQMGFVFKTHSDTEVILVGYQAWGESVVNKLRGMFTFAIWDKERRQLFLARDRLGIKPLYYSMLPEGEFIFASELKALLVHPKVKRQLDPLAVLDFFAYGYVPEPKSIFKGILKLKPGHTLTLNAGHQKLIQAMYWDVPPASHKVHDEQEAMALVKAKIAESVEIRMVAEVPLGAFLSGGVDSSVVVANMAQAMNKPVTTCGIGFDEPKFDESIYSKQVASQFKCDHHVHILKVNELQSFSSLTQVYDEPFADASAIPTLKVCELARKHVTVALSGDGGDEVMAGYRRYRGHLLEQRLRQTLPNWARRVVFGSLAACYPDFKKGPRFLRAKSTLRMLEHNAVEGYFQNISIFKPDVLKQLFTSQFLRQVDGYQPLSVLQHYASQRSGEDALSLVQYLDLKTYLPGDILTKVDRASMHHSLEVRVPLLDHTFIELAQTLSPSLKIQQQTGKYILKKSYEDTLSSEILYRKKQGFAVPIGAWFRGPWRHRLQQLKNSHYLTSLGMFDTKTIALLVDRHLSGQGDQSAMLMSLCLFEDFIKHQLFESNGEYENARVACA